MSDSRYPFTHLAPEMTATNNPNLKNNINYGVAEYEDPIHQLFSDSEIVIINGGVKELIDAKNENDYNKFQEAVKKEFSEKNLANLRKFYSQTPLYFVASNLYNGSLDEDSARSPIHFYSPEKEFHLQQDSKGDVYLTLKAKNYSISKKDDMETKISLPGVVEAVFKLTDNGFEFQKVSTDSKLLSDMYLGNKVTEKDIIEHTKIKGILDKLEDNRLNLIAQKIRFNFIPKNKLDDNLMLELNSINGVLKALDDYKIGKFDIEDLQTAVNTYQIHANHANSTLRQFLKFFTRSTVKATHQILIEMSAQLKEINPPKNSAKQKLR